MPANHHTVNEIAVRFAVTEHTVLGWIRSGELKAINVGRTTAAKKPRWRIPAAALEAFEAARSATPPATTTRTPRRRRPADVIEYYA